MSDRRTAPTRIDVAMAVIRQRMQKAGGTKLPSIRGLADQLGISKSTIVEAYDRLVAEGEIEVRPRSGFFAATGSRSPAPSATGVQLNRAIDPLWIMRQSLAASGTALRPGCGWLPDDWLPGEILRQVVRGVARDEQANFTAYGTPQGYPLLREQLARRLTELDIAADRDCILLTDSATRSIDIVCRFLLQPGDTVLIDDPCYFSFQSLLRAQRVNMIGIPHTPNGPDLERFEAACVSHRPKLYLTTAALHNPTGASIDVSTTHRLLKLAEAHDLVLVEDGVYADLEEYPSPGLAALDGFERVIYLGSFSKTLTGALRCGFIVAREEWIEGLTDLTLATGFGISDLPAQITHRLLVNGSHRHHLNGLRPRLARNMAATISHLAVLGFEPWLRPKAGMFVWAALPEGLDSAALAQRALEHNLVLAPGNAFSISQAAGRYMRFNVAQCGDRRVFDLLARTLKAGSDRNP